MTIHDDLLADVLANPDDLACRLVYADALAESGDTARAELIITACELARSRWSAIERPDLHARHAELLREHQAEWLAPLAKLGVVEATFHRGFVEEASVRASVFAQHVEELFRHTPIRTLRLLGIDELGTPDLEALLARPELARLDCLGLCGATMNHARIAAVFSKASAVTRVRSLDLSGTSWDVGALRALGSMHPAAATQVTLSNVGGRVVGVPHYGIVRVVIADVLALTPNAESITMTAPGRSVAQLIATIDTKKVKALDLNVVGAPLRANECLRLCSPRMTALEELRLRGLDVLEDLVRWLPEAPFLPQLRILELGDGGHWPNAHVMGLFALREATRLEELSLRGVSFGNALTAIVAHPARESLRSLVLHRCAIASDGLQAILESRHLDGLKRLEIREQWVPPDMEERLRARFGAGYDGGRPSSSPSLPPIAAAS